MDGDIRLGILTGFALIICNGFLAAAEYGLIGAKRTRVEALVKKGSASAKIFLKARDEIHSYVAGIQILITMISIAIGAITEPFVAEALNQLLGKYLGEGISLFISLILVTYCLVIIGDLVPKYIALQYTEKVALLLIRPLRIIMFPLYPFIWLVQKSGMLALRPMGIDMKQLSSDEFTKDEIAMLVKAGGTSGTIEEEHAQMVSKVLKLDKLCARDAMIHRVDIAWIDVHIDKDELLKKLVSIAHHFVPVCNGDIDEVVGIVRVVDVMKSIDNPDFNFEKIINKVEAIPESLSLSRVISRMRKCKTQVLIVLDEYGGTSGLVTLEDVIEEVFGEFAEDGVGKRPAIEKLTDTLYSVDSSVRYDEFLEFLGKDHDAEEVTDTLATVIVSALGTVPKLGDHATTAIGTMHVESMIHSRVTRVQVEINQQLPLPQNES